MLCVHYMNIGQPPAEDLCFPPTEGERKTWETSAARYSKWPFICENAAESKMPPDFKYRIGGSADNQQCDGRFYGNIIYRLQKQVLLLPIFYMNMDGVVIEIEKNSTMLTRMYMRSLPPPMIPKIGGYDYSRYYFCYNNNNNR